MTSIVQTSREYGVSNVASLVHVLGPGKPLQFEDGYTHYVHPGALQGVNQITIRGLKNAKIFFLTPLSGDVTLLAAYRDDTGVLNLIDCDNVLISNLIAENRREFSSSASNMIMESSNVVNVVKSKVAFENCVLKSNGKLCFMAHTDSEVVIVNSTLDGYYFELFNAASKVTCENVNFEQSHPNPDSHSALWVGSSHRRDGWNTLHENGETVIRKSKFNLESGRSIVSGNGSYHTKSTVKIEDSEILIENPTSGLCTWHKNFNSILMDVDDQSLLKSNLELDRDYVATPNTGFARFVNYYQPLTKDEVRPGGPNGESPIVVNGVSSADV